MDLSGPFNKALHQNLGAWPTGVAGQAVQKLKGDATARAPLLDRKPSSQSIHIEQTIDDKHRRIGLRVLSLTVASSSYL